MFRSSNRMCSCSYTANIALILFILFYINDNQINARALIGQSAVGYCAGKTTQKSGVF